MSPKIEKRSELLAAVGQEFRQLSTANILFHQAIADGLGMHITDHKCADILLQMGPMTAGELAKLTGLTTGAVTGVIDRLEKARMVQCAADPKDRRRVIVEPLPERIDKAVGPFFASLLPAIDNLCARYNTRELAVIREFIAGVHKTAHELIPTLREQGRRGQKRSNPVAIRLATNDGI